MARRLSLSLAIFFLSVPTPCLTTRGDQKEECAADETQVAVTRHGQQAMLSPSSGDHATESLSPKVWTLTSKSWPRLPAPEALQVSDGIQRTGFFLQDVMQTKQGDWSRAQKAARDIRNASYKLQEFYEDCVAAFPELALYVTDGGSQATTSSGRSTDDEYQRTLGALFAVYWLMRLESDGKQSFCFGVDNEGNPLSADSEAPARESDEIKKRQDFFTKANWDKFEHLFLEAGILKEEGGHDVERTLAMIVLTVIHDIMKLNALVPVLEEKHAPFRGYKVGDSISDHDAALAYILQYHPDILPSFKALSSTQKETLIFTQMDFNMGHFAQAEGPPGAVLKHFKSMIATTGNKQKEDIAFYFVHWVTDLAGAVPNPLGGSEMFVLRFKSKVVSGFFDSFRFLDQLREKSETELYEEYLKWRWQQTHAEAPSGPGSIAKMRLCVMAPGHCSKVVDAYNSLAESKSADSAVLDAELSYTGCAGQSFQSQESPQLGPAFLVYYGPALMNNAGATDPKGALQVLASVYRKARSLFPAQKNSTSADESVTVNIAALLKLQVAEITAGTWVVEKNGDSDRYAEVKFQAQ